jgi:hypothetical protein
MEGARWTIAAIVGALVLLDAAVILMLRATLAASCWWMFGHRWGPWQQWAITYQRRWCQKCGRMQTKDSL